MSGETLDPDRLTALSKSLAKAWREERERLRFAEARLDTLAADIEALVVGTQTVRAERDAAIAENDALRVEAKRWRDIVADAWAAWSLLWPHVNGIASAQVQVDALSAKLRNAALCPEVRSDTEPDPATLAMDAGQVAGIKAIRARIESTPPRSEAGPGRHPFRSGPAHLMGTCQESGCPDPNYPTKPIHQPPEGCKWAGEYREPEGGEWYLGRGGTADRNIYAIVGPRHILRRVPAPPPWLGHDFEDHASYVRRIGVEVACYEPEGACHFQKERAQHCRKLASEHGPRPDKPVDNVV